MKSYFAKMMGVFGQQFEEHERKNGAKVFPPSGAVVRGREA